jgi:hypothetical protein
MRLVPAASEAAPRNEAARPSPCASTKRLSCTNLSTGNRSAHSETWSLAALGLANGVTPAFASLADPPTGRSWRERLQPPVILADAAAGTRAGSGLGVGRMSVEWKNWGLMRCVVAAAVCSLSLSSRTHRLVLGRQLKVTHHPHPACTWG